MTGIGGGFGSTGARYTREEWDKMQKAQQEQEAARRRDYVSADEAKTTKDVARVFLPQANLLKGKEGKDFFEEGAKLFKESFLTAFAA